MANTKNPKTVMISPETETSAAADPYNAATGYTVDHKHGRHQKLVVS